MQDLDMIEDRGVLRWGGLAGTLGGILMIVVVAVVAVFVGADALEPAGNLERFPDISAARTVENGLYHVVLVLWMVHFLALYRAPRATNRAAAPFGSVLGIVGLGLLAAGALPHVATLPISCSDSPSSTSSWDGTWSPWRGPRSTDLRERARHDNPRHRGSARGRTTGTTAWVWARVLNA